MGLTRGTTKYNISQAAVESIAFQSADVLEAMRADAGIDIKMIRADGGASANDHLMQFQADVMKTEVIRPKNLETTALGAAYLAMLFSNWGTAKEGDNDQVTSTPEASPASMWVRFASQIVVQALYLWILLAGLIFPDREFGAFTS